jgi:small GTP-binding protein
MGCCAPQTNSARIIFVGLDNAGKSSILHVLSESEEPHNPRPTIGYQKITIDRYKFQLEIWDVGGDAKGRDLWRHYIKGAHAIVFVVDSANVDTLDQGQESAKRELHAVLKNDELPFTAPVLVYANKQDMTHALNKSQVADRLDLDSIKTRQWHVQQSCAITCHGIEEGIEWLCDALLTQKKEMHQKAKNHNSNSKK